MASQRVGGTIEFSLNGIGYLAAGEFTYNLGLPKRSTKLGVDRPHGYIEEPQAPMIEGEITDNGIDLARLVQSVGGTVLLKLANGKTILGSAMYFTGTGDAKTKEGNVAVKFESIEPLVEL